MFCPNCGSPLNDDAVFCPNCGSKVAAEQEIPAAPETTVLSDQTSDTVVLTPEANPWAQPVESAPADPFAQPEFSDPFAQPDSSNPFAQVSFEEEPEKPKKSKKTIWKVLVPIVAVIAVVALVWGFFGKTIEGTMVKTFGDEEDYFQYAEKAAAENVADSISTVYGTYIDAFNADQAFESTVKLSVSEDALDLLESQTGMDMDNFAWINDVVFRLSGNSKNGLSNGNLALEISEQTILDLALFLDMDAQSLILGVQNLTDQYVEFDLDELLGGPSYNGPGDAVYVDSVGLDDITALLSDGKLIEALPTEKELNSLINKYLTIMIESIDEVKSSEETIEAGDLSQKVTAIEIDVDEELTAKISEAVLKELKKDEELETIICDVAKVLEDADLIDDADEVYDNFKDSIDDALDSLEDDDEDDDDEWHSETEQVITFYIDSSHNIIGWKIKSESESYYEGEKEFSSDSETSYVTVTKGSEFATEYKQETNSSYFGYYGEETRENSVKLVGEGTKKGNKINAEYVLKVDDETMLKAEASDFEFALDGLNGKIVIEPADGLLESMGLDSQTASLVASLVDLGLSMDFSCSKNKTDITIGLINKDESFVSITVSSEIKKAENVDLPDDSDVYDMDDGQEWLESMDFDKLIDALEKTDLPDELVEQLENLLEYAGLY